MTLYWVLFSSASTLALISQNRIFSDLNRLKLYKLNSLWWGLIIVLTLIIGLRHEVGGDWSGYLNIFYLIDSDEFSSSDISLMMDPGYLYLNLISSYFGLGVYGVNFIAAFIFALGLSIFCRQLPRPLLALAVAIPYLTIVVAMGYSRQSLALGLGMIAYSCLRNDQVWKFIILILFAATFHKTAIALIPLVLASQSTNRIAVIAWLIILTPILYFLFLSNAMAFLLEHYVLNVQEGFQSQGALIRVGMNLVPAVIFLLYSARFSFNKSDANLLKLFSWATFACLLGLFLTDASAAIDRLALYILPLQLLVFSYLPDAFTNDYTSRKLIVIGIIFYYSAVLFVWLNFGVHSQEWLPYSNVLLI